MVSEQDVGLVNDRTIGTERAECSIAFLLETWLQIIVALQISRNCLGMTTIVFRSFVRNNCCKERTFAS